MLLEDIFGEVLLDHYKHPRNYGAIKNATAHIEGANPLCGDEIELFATKVDGTVKEIGFTGRSCAICTASASIFCEIAEGKSEEELDELKALFYRLLHNEPVNEEEVRKLGDAIALQGVAKLPSRVKCATLVYETWSEMKRLKTDENPEDDLIVQG